MKNYINYLILLALCISSNCVYGQKLTLKNLPGNIVINKGALSLPNKDTLKKYNVTLTYDSLSQMYTLKGVNTGVNVVGGSNGSVIIGGNTNIDGTIINTGNTNTITIDGKKVSGKNVIIVNGQVIPNNSTPITTFAITMPDNSDLKITSLYDVTINNKVTNLNLEITGSSDVTVALVTNLMQLEVTGSASVSIDSCKHANKIEITGSADVSINKCASIDEVEITGSGSLILPKNTLVSDIDMSGSGSIKRK